MLREQVTKLMDRYESGDEFMTVPDVCEELEQIMDEHGDNSVLDVYLMETIQTYVWHRHESQRYGGRVPDGGDDFIREVERIIGYN